MAGTPPPQDLERLELLKLGDTAGYPELWYAENEAVGAGRACWQAFSERASTQRIGQAVRAARLLE